MSELPSTPSGRNCGQDLLRAERLEALSRVLSPDGPPDPLEQSGPTYFPALSREEASDEWAYLRGWVEALVGRFPHVAPAAVPPCWYRHPGHVDALMALCDFQRACYGRCALPTDPLRWHRAFRDIEDRLSTCTAAAGCGGSAGHQQRRAVFVADEDDWAAFVADDLARRSAGDELD